MAHAGWFGAHVVLCVAQFVAHAAAFVMQLNQALGYKIEIEHFRRIRTDCSETVPGCNMVITILPIGFCWVPQLLHSSHVCAGKDVLAD